MVKNEIQLRVSDGQLLTSLLKSIQTAANGTNIQKEKGSIAYRADSAMTVETIQYNELSSASDGRISYYIGRRLKIVGQLQHPGEISGTFPERQAGNRGGRRSLLRGEERRTALLRAYESRYSASTGNLVRSAYLW